MVNSTKSELLQDLDSEDEETTLQFLLSLNKAPPKKNR